MLIARYLIILSSLIVMFFNLFDVIMGSKTIVDYTLYVIFFLVIAFVLIFISSNNIISIILIVTATFILISDSMTLNISYSSVFFILATYINRDIRLRIIVYFINITCLVCISTYADSDSANFINFLFAYIFIFSLSELTYQEIIRRNK